MDRQSTGWCLFVYDAASCCHGNRQVRALYDAEMSRLGRVQSAAVPDVCSHHSVHVKSLKVHYFADETLRLDSFPGKNGTTHYPYIHCSLDSSWLNKDYGLSSDGAICQTFNSRWPGVHNCWTPCLEHSAEGDLRRRTRRCSLPPSTT